MIRMKPWMAMAGSILVLVMLIALLAWTPKPNLDGARDQSLVVYCGAGVRAPVDAAARDYERDFGVTIVFRYGSSQTLVAQAELSKTGDLILPGDDAFIELAREKGLIDQSVPLARMQPVLAVAKGNPKRLRRLEDLTQPHVRLAQPAPEATATGRLVREALERSGDWERVQASTTVFKGTVNDVANDIKVGSVDAGFIWDALLTQYPELESVAIPELSEANALVSIGTLKCSLHPIEAKHFMRLFKENGFQPVNGEPRAEGP
jgi:molybdate transport system substrate-binding protein